MSFYRLKFFILSLVSLIVLDSGNVCQAFPLPTADMKRIASSARTVKLQVDQVRQEIQSNMQIIKMIQNGGYAAAAGALFGKIENGDYERFGTMFGDLKDSVKDGAIATQAGFAKGAAKEKAREKYKQAKEKEQKLREERARLASQAATGQAIAISKNNRFNKVYTWVKKYGGTSSEGIIGTVDTIKEGGGIRNVAEGLYQTAGKAGANVYEGMANDNKAQAQREAAEAAEREEASKKLLEQTQNHMNDMSNQFHEDLAKQEAEKNKAAEEWKKKQEEEQRNKWKGLPTLPQIGNGK